MPWITDDTDMELYITGEVAGFVVDLYVPGDQKYAIGADVENISEIRRQLDKEHGVSRIGDVALTLKNDTNKFNETDENSIFYGGQVIKDWVRIKAGWGPGWENDVQTQFQGRIKFIQTNERWRCRMVLYDALQDLKDAVVNSDNANVAGGLYISETQVPGMNPIDILEYLIDTVFGLTWFNMDTLVDEALLNATSLTAARESSDGMGIGATTWPMGSKLLDMASDLMKMIGGYIYSGKNGQLYVYIYTPSMDTDDAQRSFTFVGDVTVKEPEVIVSTRDLDLASIVNQVTWKYGQNGIEYTPEGDTDSQALNGIKNLDLATGWELEDDDTMVLDIAAGRLMARFAEPMPSYEITISWLRDGAGLALDLGDIGTLTDPALAVASEYVEIHRMRTSLNQQNTVVIAYDTTALQGKFCFFSSEIDERDGYGITGGNFAVNWLRRFLFFSMEDTHFNPGFDNDGNANGRIDTAFGAQDEWGNGIEEHFIFW